MNKLTQKELDFYLKYNCTLKEKPECSSCFTEHDDIYLDELDGELYCAECLEKSLNSDEDAIKELREQISLK